MKLSYRTKMEQVYFSEFQEQMEGTGLYAYGFRYYDPVIGRFTGVDPIADQFADLSGFNYANNDPIGMVDLHGLQGVPFQDVKMEDDVITVTATRLPKGYNEWATSNSQYNFDNLDIENGQVSNAFPGGRVGGMIGSLDVHLTRSKASAQIKGLF